MGLLLVVFVAGLLWLLLALLPLRRRGARPVLSSVHLVATVALVVAADRASPGQIALWILVLGPGGLVSAVRLVLAVARG
ncbi:MULTISPECIES: hypothetical protein [unclassified Streptomyces]|uniref:hypothetical protein n=1 Tax=unclassified Streptomyces TaxID=2593676 RepID=UPI000CDA5EA8|nr:hypothetical protein [Streptomyces sp. SM10]